MVRVFTIGFTRTSARAFFSSLAEAGVRKVVDVRLHNSSQLAAFAKKEDLEYFLEAISGIGYLHAPELAPTEKLFDSYKSADEPWETYEAGFKALLSERRVESQFSPEDFAEACLLCACASPEMCHRRLVAEYFQRRWGALEIVHLSPQSR